MFRSKITKEYLDALVKKLLEKSPGYNGFVLNPTKDSCIKWMFREKGKKRWQEVGSINSPVNDLTEYRVYSMAKMCGSGHAKYYSSFASPLSQVEVIKFWSLKKWISKKRIQFRAKPNRGGFNPKKFMQG